VIPVQGRAQLGGFFEPLGSVATPELLQQARGFVGNIRTELDRRFPFFQNPNAFAPIGVSAPGTPLLRQQLAAARAGVEGFPEQSFFEERARLVPRGVRPGAVRRTF